MKRPFRRVAAAAAALAALGAEALGQQAGIVDWSTMGFADEEAVPRSGGEVLSAGVLASISWRIDTDGGVVPAFGGDYVSFEAGSQGGFTGYAQFGFDSTTRDQDDRIVLFVNFNDFVTDVAFTLTDIDQATFDDAVGVYVNRGSGFENAAGVAFQQPVAGPAVIAGTTAFGVGWQGNASVASTSTDGNLAFDFGAEAIQGIAIVHTSGFGGTNTDPSAQQIGLSNITYSGPPPPPGADLRLSQIVSDETPAVGDQITYTITLTNDGPSPANVTVRDVLPSGSVYVSDNTGGAYDPATGIWQVPGPVPAGAARVLTITATVQENGQRTNLAEVWTSDQADGDSQPGNAGTDPFEDDTAQATIAPGGNTGTPGVAPQLSCASPSALDWSSNAWPSGDLIRQYTVGGTAFDFEVVGNGATFLNSAQSGTQAPVTTTELTGGGAADANVYIIVDQATRNSVVTLDVDIGTPGVGVSELQYAIYDVDYGAGQFEDRIAVAGYKGGAFVAPVLTPSSDNEVRGGQAFGLNAVGNTGGGANLTVTFQQPVDRMVITYGNGPRAPSSPGQQAIGLHDISFCSATGAQLTAAKTVDVYDPFGQGLFMLPGNDAIYTITVTNTGDGATDTDSLFLSDALPDGVTFWSGDVDGPGPETGAVAFAQAGAGLTFGPSDVGYSNQAAKPASFAACGYSPNGDYDPSVRHLCIRPRGAFQAGNGPPSFSVSFRARID